MKKALISLLIVLVVLPAFLQVMPHGIDHALHQSKAHHAQNHHGHNHDDHDDHHGHSHEAHDENHHAINLDIVSFYDEYLHVDLQSPDQVTLEVPDQDIQDISFDVVANTVTISRYELASVQSRAPPDWPDLEAGKTPLYLSTQRLRI